MPCEKVGRDRLSLVAGPENVGRLDLEELEVRIRSVAGESRKKTFGGAVLTLGFDGDAVRLDRDTLVVTADEAPGDTVVIEVYEAGHTDVPRLTDPRRPRAKRPHIDARVPKIAHGGREIPDDRREASKRTGIR